MRPVSPTVAPATAAYGGQQPHQPQRPPVVSIISPDEAKKIRNMQIINSLCALLQLGCAVAIICIVRYNLMVYYYFQNVTVNGMNFYGWNYVCLASTPYYEGTCEFAYALASVSIFWCFVISIMVCLTMDCCGMGRAVEALFDTLGLAWWVAGTVVLAYRAEEANEKGIPQTNARNAVVAMAAISAFIYLILLLTNLVLMMKLGKAYARAAKQLQQQAGAPVAAPMPYGTGTGPVAAAVPYAPTPAPGQADAKTAAPFGSNAV